MPLDPSFAAQDEPPPVITLADLVASTLLPQRANDEDELFRALAAENQTAPCRMEGDYSVPVTGIQASEQMPPTPEMREMRNLADEVRQLQHRAELQATSTQTSRCLQDRTPIQCLVQACSKPASAESSRCFRSPAVPQAYLVGVVRPKAAKLPNTSVLESSVVRRKRLCRRGPSGTSQRRDQAKPVVHVEPERLQEAEQKRLTLQQPVEIRSNPHRCKRQVESDFAQATESWMARIPSDDTLQERRQNRHRIVVANRITSRETIRAAFKGKSLLEERWIGNLDDSEADTELSVASIIAWLRRTDLYADTALTHVEVLNFVQQILAGREVNAVCNVAGRRSKTISAIQFQAIIRWIAQHKGITYSECITKLVHHPNERTRLEHYFQEFAHATSHGYMTVYEFTRFCRAYGLFKLRPGRFVQGDVQFLFDKGGEGKALDLEGFRRVLEQVAARVDMPAQDLLHFLGEKDAERVFREGMDSAGLRRKAVVAK